MYPFSLEKSKNNRDILKINGRYIHSRFAPEKEAQNISYPGQNLIAVFGLGLAYHVNNLIESNPDSFFIVFEPHQEIKSRFSSLVTAKSRERLLIIDSLDEPAVFSFIEKSRVIYSGRIHTYSNTGYKSLYQSDEQSFFSLVKKSFELVVQNVITEANFLPLWTKNVLYNLKKTQTFKIADITYSDKGKNLAVIVCSGPSVDTDMEQLRKYRDHITIFAVDTSLKPLLKNKIIPDFVVSLDGQYYSLDDFVPESLPECAFIFDITSYPKVQHLCRKGYFTFTSNLYQTSILGYIAPSLGLSPTLIETGGTVSDFALSIACRAGFTNIYITGLDLSFPALLTHCKHSPYYDRLLYSTGYFNPPLSHITRVIGARNVFKEEGKEEDSQVFTDFILKNYAAYFQYYAKTNPDLNLWYSEAEGLKLEGFKRTSLKSLHPAAASSRFTHHTLGDSWKTSSVDREDLNRSAARLAEELYEQTKELAELLNTTDFTSASPALLTSCSEVYNKTITSFPFLKGFTLMSEMILSKKNIYQTHLIWYKHIFFKMLQSMYYIIRTLQRLLHNL